MDEIYVYHVVTERPMVSGQKIWFDEEHTNGVYQRVMATKNILDHKDINQADINQELTKLINTDLEKWTKVMYREMAMEKVRHEKFPQYPSRMACLYTSRTLDEAKNWANYFRELGRNVYGIVKLHVCGRIFDGDATLCFDGTSDEEDNLFRGYHYWNLDQESENPVIETLVDGEITVVEVIEDNIIN